MRSGRQDTIDEARPRRIVAAFGAVVFVVAAASPTAALEQVGNSDGRLASVDVRGVAVGDPPGDELVDIPDVVGVPLAEALDTLRELDLEVDWIPSELPAEDDVVIVHAQFSAPADRFVELRVGTLVPALAGMTPSEAADETRRHALELVTDGDDDGVVAGQEPDPGTPIDFGDTVIVTFELDDGGPGSRNPWLLGGGGVVIVGAGWAIRRKIRKHHEPTREPDHEHDRDPDRHAPVVTTNLVLHLPRVDIDLPDGDRAGTATVIEARPGSGEERRP